MTEYIAGVPIPDTRLVADLTELVKAAEPPLLFHHSRRVYLFGMLQGRAFTNGFKDRPDTTFGTVNADVLEHFSPGFRRTDFVEVIQSSAWPE
ncbi:MAG TPA: hypothetical protein VGG83_16060 [Trebonia sp.]|jgi:hypothetical protein